ncbi:MAG TPA: hypothetical protein DDY91_07535 [Planctomycetaceae bacterium]|nr:hypothetical protein [Planctomycetaceae bacterium]
MARKPKYNPNAPKFPRGKFLKSLKERCRRRGQRLPHELYRKALETALKAHNPHGYHHDLGALDVFLDNYGAILEGQFRNETVRKQYLLDELIAFFKELQRIKEKFGGSHSSRAGVRNRSANSGEPRPLLRMLDSECEPEGESRRNVTTLSESAPSPETALISDWSDESLIRPETLRKWGEMKDRMDTQSTSIQEQQKRKLGGVKLTPEQFGAGIIDRPTFLPVSAATPDLPVRVGTTRDDIRLCNMFLRNQGSFPSCVANAVVTAFEMAIGRSFAKPYPIKGLSVSALHIQATYGRIEEGTSLAHAIDTFEEHGLPYECFMESVDMETLAKRYLYQPDLFNKPHKFPASNLEIDRLDVYDIARLKARIAHGWTVVLTTKLTEAMMAGGFEDYGLLLTPFREDKIEAEGHAWAIVGYDHIDGNSSWKYQGHFLALNSWGAAHPTFPTLCPGICRLPFALVYAAGLEAYAIRAL